VEVGSRLSKLDLKVLPGSKQARLILCVDNMVRKQTNDELEKPLH